MLIINGQQTYFQAKIIIITKIFDKKPFAKSSNYSKLILPIKKKKYRNNILAIFVF